MAAPKKTDNLTDGQYKQLQQGHHGIKGAELGKSLGHLSIDHPNTLKFQKALANKAVANHGRKARTDKSKPALQSYLVTLNFKQRCAFIETVEELLRVQRTESIPWLKAACLCFGKSVILTAYPTQKESNERNRQR